MEFHRYLCLMLVLLTIVSSSQAYKFYVGGSSGWVPNPSENYNEWAGRNRFQINDTLVFKYKKGSDSVLEVNKESYDKCNKTNPIKKFDDGDTEFKFERSGPFYFISGYDQNCEKGQKLIVVVLAPRGQSHTPSPPQKSPSPSPSPKPLPPSSPPSPSHQPSGPLPAPTPTPSSHPPSPSPAVSPIPARAPLAPSPVGSPGPVGGSLAPEGKSPSPAGLPGPVGGPPVPSTKTPPSPTGTSPSSSTGSPPSSPGGVGGMPSSSNETAPPPPSHAWSAGPSGFLVFSVTIVVGAVLLL